MSGLWAEDPYEFDMEATSGTASPSVIRPTLPGKVAGVVCMEPFTVQCQACGVEASGTGRNAVSLVVLTSGILFHPTAWTTGHTDNPRMCRDCRMGRGCECHRCKDERRGA